MAIKTTIHLKPRKYYVDLYDRHTVEQCRWHENYQLPDEELEEMPKKEAPELSRGQQNGVRGGVTNIMLYFVKGDRYAKKEERIREWMDFARRKDERLHGATVPPGIQCLTCGSGLDEIMRDLRDKSYDDVGRVIFMLECPNGHLPRRMLFDDGEEWAFERDLCPKCETELDSEDATTEEKFITNYKCASCDFTKTDEIIRTLHEEEKPDPDYEKDRQRFCLSVEDGGEYISWMANLDQLTKSLEKHKEREEQKDLYDAVEKLRKLTVAEVKTMLNEVIEKCGYINLQFSQPEMGKDVFVPFTANDAKSGREEYDSRQQLKKLITETLVDTNWRLMGDAIAYRLGILSGRLRAYEREDDLIKLIKTGKKKGAGK